MNSRKTVLDPGDTLAGYTIERMLGAGGFGAVYEARLDGELVALKVAHSLDVRSSAGALAGQQNEIEAMMRLDHPSVVRVRDFGFGEGGRFYLALELAEGEDLEEYLRRRGALEAVDALRIAEAVARALAHCHERDVLHLDLKPANVIITDASVPKIKVLDFGLARLRRTWQHGDAPLAGTPDFMPPEALAGGEAQSPTTDIYALGVILYMMLAGRVPFKSLSLLDLYQQKASGGWPPLREVMPNVPAAVEALVSQLLAADVKERRISASAVADRLREVYFAVLAGSDHTSEVPSPIQTGAAQPSEVEFVGRQRELGALTEALSQCEPASAGRAIVLVGESGVGKSRLLGAFLDAASKVPSRLVALGRCREFGALTPYGVLREFLGNLVERVMGLGGPDSVTIRDGLTDVLASDRALLSHLVPELVALDTETGGGGDLSSLTLAGPHRIVRGVSKILETIGKLRPVVIALEDLHWVDAATVTALDSLLAAPPGGVLLVATTRPVADVALRAEALVLRNLAADDNVALLSHLMSGAPAAEVQRLIRAIPLLREGNPLFNTQLVRNLELEGRLVRSPAGSLQVGERGLAGYKAPTSVSAVLERTASRLSEISRDILVVAALIGRDFLASDLIGVGLFEIDQIDAALEEGRKHNLCAPSDPTASQDHMTFVHSAVHTFFEGRLEARMGDIHRRIAEVLEARRAPAGRLAQHFEWAGEPLKAAAAYLEGAREADSLQNPASARDLFERSFNLTVDLPSDPDRDRLLTDTVWALARIDCAVGRVDTTLSRIDACEASLGELGDRTRAVLASARARVHYTRGSFAEAVASCRQCLAIEGSDLGDIHLAPANILGRTQMVSGNFTEAVRLLKRGCELAEEAGAFDEVAHSSAMLGLSLAFVGRYNEAELTLARAASLADRLGDPVRIIAALFYEATLAEASFDVHRMVSCSARLLAMVEEKKVGGLYFYLGTMFAGRGQFRLGHVDRAQALLERALQLSREMSMTMGNGWLLTFLGDVHFVRGELGLARTYYDRSLQAANAGGRDEYAAGVSLAALAHLSGLTGGSAETVLRWGWEMVERLERVDARALLPQNLQRFEEGVRAAGGADKVADELVARREALMTELGKAYLDWWPQPNEEWEGPRSSYWLGRIRTHAVVRPDDVGDQITRVLNTNPILDSKTLAFEPATAPNTERPLETGEARVEAEPEQPE